MNKQSAGLILEGPYDEPVFAELIPRIFSTPLTLRIRLCGGVTELMKYFPTYLREFEKVLEGHPVLKAFVIRDSGGKDVRLLHQDMANKISGQVYAFPRGFQICIVRRTTETWLLADSEAISTVALNNGGKKVPEIQGTLEDIVYPKEKLRSVLSRAKVMYVPKICGEIAKYTRLDLLRYRCPSFRDFETRVHDC